MQPYKNWPVVEAWLNPPYTYDKLVKLTIYHRKVDNRGLTEFQFAFEDERGDNCTQDYMPLADYITSFLAGEVPVPQKHPTA